MPYLYDETYYDGASASYFDFELIWDTTGDSTSKQVRVNYITNGKSFKTLVYSINDNLAADLAKRSIDHNKFAIEALIDKEEGVHRKMNPSKLIVYGWEDDGVDYNPVAITTLRLAALERNIFNVSSLVISDTYNDGTRVSQSLEDDLETTPGDLLRQVITIKYRDRLGHQVAEYAGTPRQIINWLVGGLPFAKDEYEFALPVDLVENEKAIAGNYTDGRLKPGDNFNNSVWIGRFDDVVSLVECELQFVDSNNAPIYALYKNICAILEVARSRARRFFNKHFVNSFDMSDIDYWNKILDTNIYNQESMYDELTTITSIDTDVFGTIKRITVANADHWPDWGFARISANEIIQYRERSGNELQGIDRAIGGNIDYNITVGDVARLWGSGRIYENENLIRSRFRAIMGPKETTGNIENALESVIENSPQASVRVFDIWHKDYWSDQNMYPYVFVIRDAGWHVDDRGTLLLEGTATYNSSTDTLTFSSVVEGISTGDQVYAIIDDVEYSEYVWDVDGLDLELTGSLVDSDGAELANGSSVLVSVYLKGTETLLIRSSASSSHVFPAQLYLGRERETTGYFHNTLDLASIRYETDVSGQDTSIFNPTGVCPAISNVDTYNYTGKISEYNVEAKTVRELNGKYPFIVFAEKWDFNDEIIYDTVERLKAVGTTPNYVINSGVKSFATFIANEHHPYFDFVMTWETGV